MKIPFFLYVRMILYVNLCYLLLVNVFAFCLTRDFVVLLSFYLNNYPKIYSYLISYSHLLNEIYPNIFLLFDCSTNSSYLK